MYVVQHWILVTIPINVYRNCLCMHVCMQVSICLCIMYVQYIRYYAKLRILLAASLYLPSTRRHGFEGSQKNSNFACEKPHHSKHKVFWCYYNGPIFRVQL